MGPSRLDDLTPVNSRPLGRGAPMTGLPHAILTQISWDRGDCPKHSSGSHPTPESQRLSPIYAALVRHADYHQPSEVPSALLPHPLTQEGEAQALRLGDELADLCEANGWLLEPTLHASSLLRAWQTAELAAGRLAERLGGPVEVVTSSALHERSVGSAANLTVSEIEAAVHADPRYTDLAEGWKSKAHTRLPFPGAESLADAGERVARYVGEVLASIESADASKLVVFIGHGASLRHAGVDLGLFESYDEARSVSMYHARPVVYATAESGGWQHEVGAWKPRKQESRID